MDLQFFNIFLQYELWNNTGQDYLIAVGIFLAIFLGAKVAARLLLTNLEKATEKTKTDVDNFLIKLIHHIRPPFYFFVSIYFALSFLQLNPIIKDSVFAVFLVVVIVQGLLLLQKVIDYIIDKKFNKEKEEERDEDKLSVIRLGGQIIKGILWVLGILMVLANLGVNVTSLVAGLGIGGIAVAFALQNVLADLFASFSIFVDKPFKVGDFITSGTDSGTVRKIGIKTTRITSIEGQELVIPNKELTDARVRNAHLMERRRVLFTLGVVYQTDMEKMKRVILLIQDIIQQIEEATLDRVYFKEFGPYSLNFEVVYYVESKEYNVYVDVQQRVNMAIFERFAQAGIEFAYPTQTVYSQRK
jgi:small-conductance mechanosensitive channel